MQYLRVQYQFRRRLRQPAAGRLHARNAGMSAAETAAEGNPPLPEIRTLYVNSPGGGRLPGCACIHL